MVYPEFVENKNKNNNVEEKNNKLRINKLKEERDHSTSVSSNPQISNSKSNISTKDMCKKVDKNDDTPINDENLFQITPHFWNENTYNSNKHSIQLKLKDKKPNEEKNNKKTKFSRPLTPNLNIIRKVCIPITKKEEKIVNKDNKLIDNILIKNKDKDNKRIETTEDIKAIMEKKLSKRIGKDKDIIKTDHSVRKRSFSYTKNKILKNSKNINTNISINENEINKNMQNHQIIKYYNNYKIKNNNKIPNVNQSNCYSNNNIPFSFNNNRSLLTKNKNNTNSKNSMQKKTKRKNTSMPSHRGSTNCMLIMG